MEKRQCTHCGEEHPADPDHFFHSKKDGLSHVCRVCMSKQKKMQRERAAERRQKSLDKIEQAGLDIYAAAARHGGNNIPHSAELVEKVCEYFGGVSGFAAIMVKQYYDAKAGSSTRNKMLETVVRLIHGNVEQGGTKKPLDLWTEEELEEELQSRFRMAVIENRTILDATPQTKRIEDSSDTDADPAPAEPDSGNSLGTPDEEERGSESVRPEYDAGTDAPMHGE